MITLYCRFYIHNISPYFTDFTVKGFSGIPFRRIYRWNMWNQWTFWGRQHDWPDYWTHTSWKSQTDACGDPLIFCPWNDSSHCASRHWCHSLYRSASPCAAVSLPVSTSWQLLLTRGFLDWVETALFFGWVFAQKRSKKLAYKVAAWSTWPPRICERQRLRLSRNMCWWGKQGLWHVRVSRCLRHEEPQLFLHCVLSHPFLPKVNVWLMVMGHFWYILI